MNDTVYCILLSDAYSVDGGLIGDIALLWADNIVDSSAIAVQETFDYDQAVKIADAFGLWAVVMERRAYGALFSQNHMDSVFEATVKRRIRKVKGWRV